MTKSSDSSCRGITLLDLDGVGYCDSYAAMIIFLMLFVTIEDLDAYMCNLVLECSNDLLIHDFPGLMPTVKSSGMGTSGTVLASSPCLQLNKS